MTGSYVTHTPSPMDFLRTILGRPENEKPFLLLVTGFPAAEVREGTFFGPRQYHAAGGLGRGSPLGRSRQG